MAGDWRHKLVDGADAVGYNASERVTVTLNRDATLVIHDGFRTLVCAAEWPDHHYSETTPERFSAWAGRRVGLALSIFEALGEASG